MKKAFLSLHASIFLAGFTGVLGRLITLNEGMLVWWRLFITLVTMAAIFFITGSLRKVPKSLHYKIAKAGAFVALHWVFFYASIKYANVSVGLVCFSSVGFFSAFFEPMILKRKLDWIEVLFGSLAIVGIGLIFHFDGQYELGIILGLISSVFAAIFPILNKNLVSELPAGDLTFHELTWALLILTLLMPFYHSYFSDGRLLPNGTDFLWLLGLSWLCTIVAFNLSLQSLKKISPFAVNLSFNLEPVYGIIWAFVIYRENQYLNDSFYYGVALILLTVTLQTIRLYNRRNLNEV